MEGTEGSKGEVQTDAEVRGAQGSSHKAWNLISLRDLTALQSSGAVGVFNSFQLLLLN